ncbi:MAG TPA: hypothetical protein PKZ40_06945 [Anaerolineaceae bacterium]|nr:hypothetical protein [Anaerolineaceae bacterium]
MAGIIAGSDWIAKIPVGGTYTATTTDASAGKVEIATGKPEAVGFVATILRGGADVTAKAKISIAAGVLKIQDNSSDFDVTNGDVIHWIVY